MFRTLSISRKRTAIFAVGIVLGLASIVGLSALSTNKVKAATPGCDSDVIMYCGFTDPTDFIRKARTNDSGNGHFDLNTIYSHYNLPTSEYDRFVREAKPATIYRDGRVVVDGKTVATDGQNLGREAGTQGPGSYPIAIGGTTYYGNANSRTYANDLPGYVLFDNTGTMQFATLKLCGNPIFGNVVKTSASCSALQSTPVSGKMNTYSFTASATSTGNATITKFVYDFGDGSPTVTATSGTQAVEHTYSKAGNFTAKVTVYASVPGNPNLQLPVVGTCTKVINITIPYCVELSGAILDKTKLMYSFVAKASFGGGVTFKSADFVFGDGKSQNGVTPNGTTATVNHTYDSAGNYNAAATLHFSVNGADYTAPTCTAKVTPEQPPTPTCKPGVPVGSPECTPCPYDSSLSNTSDQCKPQVLPDTGAGNVIAIFAALVVAGFLVYRQLLFRKHKAAFVAAQNGTSPLPLGDPLSEDAPLAGTPLAQRPTSNRFRRKRPF